MVTSGVIYHVLRFFTFPVDIRNICVLLAPACSGLTALAAYLLTNEISSSPSAGLLAAVFMGITPGYISRSVAGSYDNEAIAIFLLVFTFYLWIKALKEGSAMWGSLAALFYGYMVASWGGYVFITNLVPLHAFVLICMGRYSARLYVSYTTWYALGTLASMQVPFVGFLPIRSSDHMAALGMFRLFFWTILRYANTRRCLWSNSIGGICRLRPYAIAQPSIPDFTAGNGPPGVCRGFRRSGTSYSNRCHRTMEWTLLLPMGYGLRQNSHPDHCFCVRAPADRLACIFLRS